ncbi:MAG: hypothetical protein Q4B50_07085 [Bacillota bacterium]|nr:hypothetical protein [Bacillota bacterium]
MTNFFKERFDKYFSLMKEEFPDYEDFKGMTEEPQEAGVVLYPRSPEEVLQEEKMKYHLAQGMKKMEEIYQLWKKQDEDLSPQDRISQLKGLHKEANKHFKGYMEKVKEIGDYQTRMHIFEPLYTATFMDSWLVHRMEPLLKPSEIETAPKCTTLEDAEARAKVQRKKEVTDAMNKPLSEGGRQTSFLKGLYNSMKASYDSVLWNSTEYKAMFNALKPFKDGMPEENLDTLVNTLREATANYISLKKNIPITENGKTRLNLARQVLDIADLLQSGLQAETALEKAEHKPELEEDPLNESSSVYEIRVNDQTDTFKRKVPEPLFTVNEENLTADYMEMEADYEEKVSLTKEQRQQQSPYDDLINSTSFMLSNANEKERKNDSFKTEAAKLMVLLVARQKFREEGILTINISGFSNKKHLINEMKEKMDSYLSVPGKDAQLPQLLENVDKFYNDFLQFQASRGKTQENMLSNANLNMKNKSIPSLAEK